ncbi:MAG: TrpR-related protein YerC/YecD [Francisellaceae bacterium]|jgi:TrpR-related protein YerC/YecD
MNNKLKDLKSLYQAIASIGNEKEAKLFFEDIATPAERHAFSDRWLACNELKKDKSYRTVSSETGISVTTVGRVSRSMSTGKGGYNFIYNKLTKGKTNDE